MEKLLWTYHLQNTSILLAWLFDSTVTLFGKTNNKAGLRILLPWSGSRKVKSTLVHLLATWHPWNHVSYYCTPIRMTKIEINTTRKCWYKDAEPLSMGMQNGTVTLEDILAVSYKTALDHIMQQSCSFVFTQRSWKLFTQKSARGYLWQLYP